MHEVGQKIRLQMTVCSQMGQGFGKTAKQFKSGLCFCKVVRVEPRGKDRYDKTIANVYLPDEKLLHQELVPAGIACWCRKYAPDDVSTRTFTANSSRYVNTEKSHLRPRGPSRLPVAGRIPRAASAEQHHG